MTRRRKPELPGEVNALRKRIEQWRRTRKMRSRMPEPLWSAATELAVEHGIFRIARAVGVDYAALRRHVEKAHPQSSSPRQTFVELPPLPLAAQTTIELSDDRGTKMSCRINGRTDVDVVALVSTFWNRQR